MTSASRIGRCPTSTKLSATAVTILLLMTLLCNTGLTSGSTILMNKRNAEDAASLQECLGTNHGGGGMKRQLRSDGLNMYLFGLAKCVAAVGRPRFGKRTSKGEEPQDYEMGPFKVTSDLARPLLAAAAELEDVSSEAGQRPGYHRNYRGGFLDYQ